MSGQAVLPGLNLPPASLTPENAIWGIDPSTRRMSVAVLVPVAARERLGVTVVVDTLSLPQPEKNEALRLAEAQAAMVPWLGGLLATWRPEVVVVESPFAHGRLVPVESFHVIGVLLAVLGTFGVRVERLNPGQWKKAAMGAGAGGTKKPPVKCPRRGGHDFRVVGDAVECSKCGAAYGVLTWARAAGYDGYSWDEADAIGLATAGGVVLERRRRLA